MVTFKIASGIPTKSEWRGKKYQKFTWNETQSERIPPLWIPLSNSRIKIFAKRSRRETFCWYFSQIFLKMITFRQKNSIWMVCATGKFFYFRPFFVDFLAFYFYLDGVGGGRLGGWLDGEEVTYPPAPPQVRYFKLPKCTYTDQILFQQFLHAIFLLNLLKFKTRLYGITKDWLNYFLMETLDCAIYPTIWLELKTFKYFF